MSELGTLARKRAVQWMAAFVGTYIGFATFAFTRVIAAERADQ